MTKISLRGYVRDIEQLIKQDKIDEAVAHCKYLLKIFPKHIDTYRLLGQAYLENQQYTEAEDIFQRVLNVIPDDFISHYGVSIINEDEGNLDAAIWHMERAFEVQPSNATIQADLKRLFGRRDGVEPLKIRLSRGALIRMYVRGELYPQAISEIETALSEDQQRLDLKVTLAKLFSLLGRQDKTRDICTNILESSAYCYEPNKLMFDILPDKEVSAYKERLIEIDPYASFLSSKMQEASSIPEHAIMLEKLEWNPSEMEKEQPGWAVNVGADIKDESPSDTDWLFEQEEKPVAESAPETIRIGLMNELPQTASIEDDIFEIKQEDESTIPDWMKSAGWEKSEAESQPDLPEETEALFELEPDENEPADAVTVDEIPDWLKPAAPEIPESTQLIAPVLFEEKAQEEQGTPLDADLSWLESLAVKQGVDQDTLITSAQDRTDTPPEWLSDFTSEEMGKEVSAESQPVEPTTLDVESSTQAEMASLQIPLEKENLSGFNDKTVKIDRTILSQILEETESNLGEEAILENTASEEEEALPAWIGENLPADFEKDVEEPALFSSEEELPDWLREVDHQEENELSSQPAIIDPQDTINDEVVEEISEEELLPNWLQDMEMVEAVEPLSEMSDLEFIEEEDQPAPEFLEITPLETLDEKPVEPTQFVSGEMVEAYPEFLKDLEAEENGQAFDEVEETARDLETGEQTEALFQDIKTEEPVQELEVEEPALGFDVEDESVELFQDIETEEPVQDLEVEEGTGEPVQEIDKAAFHQWTYEDQTQPIKAIDNADILESARQSLRSNHVVEAIPLFNQLIREKSFLPQVIDELVTATTSSPYSTDAWEALGDAYAQNNELQNALNAYTQAEILLR